MATERPKRLTPSNAFLAASVIGVVMGIVLHMAGHPRAGDVAWAITTAVGILPVAWEVLVAIRHRQAGVDLIALLAMAGALTFGAYSAGAVIALMLASGRSLENFADSRAHRELSSLLERAPRNAYRYMEDDLETIPIDEVMPGDLLLVKPGDVIPVDGVLASGNCVLDESALTGESRPVERSEGDQVRSGAVNAGGAFDLRATVTAAESTYSGIVRLVEEAQRQKAPFVRLADRYALLFIPVTLVIAGLAWAISGDPVRALAVLVVATPCPLILAAPIAIVAGISRAAKRGIIVKGGGALETLARGTVLLFDKTGTLTAGVPEVSDVEVFDEVGGDELLRLAASLDQASPHVLAGAIVRAARQRGLELAFPDDVHEEHGAGIEGRVDGRGVSLGKMSWITRSMTLPPRARDLRRRSAMDGSTCVFVAVDGRVAGALLLDDPIRPDTPRVIRTLRRAGIKRVVMVTGDHADVAESVGIAIGVDRILSERDPTDKVDAVKAEGESGVTIMVGDGARRRGHRRGDGRSRRDRVLGGGGRGARGRSPGPHGRGDPHRPALARDRGAERAHRHGVVVRGDAVRRVRPAGAGGGGDRAGGDRRRRDPQRAARAHAGQGEPPEPRSGLERRGAVPGRAQGVRAVAAAHPHDGRPARDLPARAGAR